MDVSLEDFKGYLLDEKSVSQNTLLSYMRDVEHYFHYLDLIGKKEAFTMDKKGMEGYISYLKKNGKTNSTITRNIASIRCLYQFYLIQGYTTTNPARQLKVEKEQKKLPEILTGEEINILLAQPDVTQLKGCRDKAMLELLYATGIRVSELIDLNVEDIHLDMGFLHCKNAKTSRMIPVYDTAVACVQNYLARVRALIATQESGQALFVNLNGKRLTRQGFWKIVKGYAQEAKIRKDITPHTLRHSFALHLLENGAQLKDIQEMLGHVDISSTQVYAEMIQNKYKAVYTKCHPRARI